jgi:hypothetical protein
MSSGRQTTDSYNFTKPNETTFLIRISRTQLSSAEKIEMLGPIIVVKNYDFWDKETYSSYKIQDVPRKTGPTY